MGGNSDEEVDLDAAMDEIATDLFSEDIDEGSEEESEGLEDPSPTEGPEQVSESVTPLEESVPAQTSTEVQDLGAPKTWTKEALQDWATIPERARQEILKREEDFHRGIEGYKQFAERGRAFDEVLAPYSPLLASAQIDPIQLVSSFAGNHYILSMGSPQEKAQVALNLMANYGIDPIQLAQLYAQSGGTAPVDPEVAHLRQQLGQLQQQIGQQAQFQQNIALENANAVIAEFKLNHEFFDDVSDDMIQLLEKGAASTLQEAYDIAIYRNTVVRDKIIASQTRSQSSPTAPTVPAKKAALKANVKTSSQPKNGTVPVGTMDDTLKETLDEILSRAD